MYEAERIGIGFQPGVVITGIRFSHSDCIFLDKNPKRTENGKISGRPEERRIMFPLGNLLRRRINYTIIVGVCSI